jgi:hypothetical protein
MLLEVEGVVLMLPDPTIGADQTIYSFSSCMP